MTRHHEPVGGLLVVACCATGVVAGLGLAHALEVPGKEVLSGPQVAAVHHHLYGGFAVVGGIAEVVAGLALGWASWRRRGTDGPVPLVVGSAAVAGALAVYGGGLRPLNQRISTWDGDHLPAGWEGTLHRWEAWHGVSLLLSGVAFGCCLVGLRREWRAAGTARSAAPEAARGF
jgi:hypothetical protein